MKKCQFIKKLSWFPNDIINQEVTILIDEQQHKHLFKKFILYINLSVFHLVQKLYVFQM